MAPDERPWRSATSLEVEAYLAEFGTVDTRRAIVRPYARTGGRTHAGIYLAIEAMVVACRTRLPLDRVAPEHRLIRGICDQARSVAEVAAYAQLPIGGARVIIADMLNLDLLVRCSTEAIADGPSIDLMSRVLSGLRHL